MAPYSIEILNLDKFQALLKEFPRVAEKHLQKAIDQGAAEVHKNATRANVPWKTGNLVQSFGVVRGRLYADVAPGRGTPAKYAKWVHDGYGPRVIVPKSIGYKGHPGGLKTPFGVFNKIKHPGFKGNPFIPRIIEKARPKIDEHFKNALDNIIKETTDV